MNQLHYTQKETPPDRWRWKCPRTGHVIAEMDKGTWLGKIAKFHRDNELLLEDGWQARAEHELCMTLPPGFCAYADGSKPQHQAMNTRSTAEVVASGSRVFLEFVLKGGKIVAPEVADERARTCAACYASVNVPGCGGCVGLANMVMDIVGTGTTSADEHLRTKSCAWCGCSALANAWMPLEISEKGVTDAMLHPDASPSWCWKANGIRELRALTKS